MKKCVILLPLVVYLLQSCDPMQIEPEKSALWSGPPKKTPPITVATTSASFRSIPYQITGNGRIQAKYDEVLQSDRAGVLHYCTAQSGQRVKAGDILAILDTTTLALRLEKLAIQRFHAQQQYESQLLGYGPLLQGKSAAEIRAVEQKLRASSGVAALDVELRELKHELAAATIQAPADGVLADVEITTGMHVRPGQALCRIYSDQQLFLEVPILESDLFLLQKDLPAQIFPLADAKKGYPATLTEINPIVEPDGMARVRLRIHHPARLSPGMHAAAEISIPTPKGIVIPKNALVMRNQRPVVFTLEHGKAIWNYVTPGFDNGNEVQILQGIARGAIVITSNNLQLAHHTPVQPTN